MSKIAVRSLVIVMLAGILGPAGAQAHDGVHLHIASGHYPPLANDQRTGFHDLILKEAFRRAGIGISLRRVPTGRAGPLANSGREDGCGPRIAAFVQVFPDLVPIEETAITFEFVAFTNQRDINVTSWADLSDHTVAHLTGSILLARKSQKYASSVTRVKTVEQLFQLLERRRVDLVVIERWTGLHAIKTMRLENVRMLQPALSRKPMYFFLNKKHAELAPRLADALAQMKADGTYDRAMVETLNPLLLRGF